MKKAFGKAARWLAGKKTYLSVLAGLLAQYGAISARDASAVTDVLDVLPAMMGDPTTYGLVGLAALRAGVKKNGSSPS